MRLDVVARRAVIGAGSLEWPWFSRCDGYRFCRHAGTTEFRVAAPPGYRCPVVESTHRLLLPVQLLSGQLRSCHGIWSFETHGVADLADPHVTASPPQVVASTR